MKKKEKMKSFEVKKLDLKSVKGGQDTGIRTDTSDCTWRMQPGGHQTGDTDRDGDWVSTC